MDIVNDPGKNPLPTSCVRKIAPSFAEFIPKSVKRFSIGNEDRYVPTYFRALSYLTSDDFGSFFIPPHVPPPPSHQMIC